EEAHIGAAGPPGRGDECGDQQDADDEADAARGRRADDAEGTLGHQPSILGKRPRGLSARMRKKTRWPARIWKPGAICAPSVCATPSTMPPASVPQSEPRPPMITASKPKMRRPGPLAGSKLVRTARKMPAMATTPAETAMASA